MVDEDGVVMLGSEVEVAEVSGVLGCGNPKLLRPPILPHFHLDNVGIVRSTSRQSQNYDFAKMVSLSQRMRKLQTKLLAMRLGSGAYILPKDIKRIHMRFAPKLNNGHMGPRYLQPLRASETRC